MTISLAFVLIVLVGGTAILVDRFRAEAARLRLLIDFSEQLQLSPTVLDALRIVPAFARRLFPFLEGAAYFHSPISDAMKLAASWGEQREEEVLEPSDCNALLTRAMHRSGDTICEHAAGDPDATTLCVPMLEAGDTFGLLVLRAPAGAPMPAGIETLARPFAHQVALALSNLRLQETLRSAAVRDSLTGLFNRRCITESITLELLGGGDPAARIGVILIDVDHFKHFNDTWGHGGGDNLLQQLARLMQDVFDGEDDIVCRYGGEEFLVVLPDVSAETLFVRANHFLDRVRDLHVDCDGRIVTGITVSAGVAISPRNATTIDGLIAEADRALYTAKSAGRNRVATPPLQVMRHTAA